MRNPSIKNFPQKFYRKLFTWAIAGLTLFLCTHEVTWAKIKSSLPLTSRPHQTVTFHHEDTGITSLSALKTNWKYEIQTPGITLPDLLLINLKNKHVVLLDQPSRDPTSIITSRIFKEFAAEFGRLGISTTQITWPLARYKFTSIKKLANYLDRISEKTGKSIILISYENHSLPLQTILEYPDFVLSGKVEKLVFLKKLALASYERALSTTPWKDSLRNKSKYEHLFYALGVKQKPDPTEQEKSTLSLYQDFLQNFPQGDAYIALSQSIYFLGIFPRLHQEVYQNKFKQRLEIKLNQKGKDLLKSLSSTNFISRNSLLKTIPLKPRTKKIRTKNIHQQSSSLVQSPLVIPSTQDTHSNLSLEASIQWERWLSKIENAPMGEDLGIIEEDLFQGTSLFSTAHKKKEEIEAFARALLTTIYSDSDRDEFPFVEVSLR